MNDSGPLIFFLVGIPAVVLIRLVAGNLDRERIRESIENGGGKVLNIRWTPFGPGWGGRERIYEVRYETRHGKIRTVSCKTSMFTGLYWAGQSVPATIPGLDESPATDPAHANGPEGFPPDVPVTCLSCGSRFPVRERHCPACGWEHKS